MMTKILAIFFLWTTQVHSFVVGPMVRSTTALRADVPMEVDFDAPVDRMIAAGNVVRRAPFSVSFGDFGTLTFEKTIGLGAFGTLALPSFKNGGGVKSDLDFLNIMDDECYLGKDGSATECVDFDPLH